MSKSDPAPDDQQILNGLLAIRNRHHLVSIHPDGGPLRGMPFDLTDPFNHDLMLHWVKKQQDQGRNIYFHANPVKQGFQGVKASKDDISLGTHAQLDLDPDGDPNEDYQIRRDRAKFAVKRINRDNPPTVIIDSGNGFNILWELDDPETDPDIYEQRNRDMNAAYGMTGTYNIDRILKVPGTVAYSNKVKLDKGYPPKRQAKLIKVSDTSTTFDLLPDSGGSVPLPAGPVPTIAKDTEIPLPAGINPNEKAKLRDLISKDKALQTALKAGNYPDQSQGLQAVAGCCFRNPKIDRLDFAAIVILADQSDAHQHLMRQQEKERALGRAWDEAGKPDFGAIDDPKAVPPEKPDIGQIIGTVLPDQGDLLGKVFPVKRAYVEQWTMEGVRLLGGAQKSGKSWLFLQEAQAVAEGRLDYLGMKVHRGRVLYVGLEDGDRRLADRLRGLAVAPCNDIKYWQETWTQDSGAGNLEVLERLHTMFPFDVVYIDTLKYWFGAAGARFGTAYDQSVEDMKPLVKFCQAKHVALCLTTHLKKDKRGIDDWQDLFQGSIGYAATVDTLTMLERKRGDDDAILHRSGRDLDDESDIAIQWNDMPRAWELSPFSATTVAAHNQARSGSMKQQIIGALQAHGPSMDKADLRLQVQGDRSRFYRALRDLETQGTIGVHDDNVFLI